MQGEGKDRANCESLSSQLLQSHSSSCLVATQIRISLVANPIMVHLPWVWGDFRFFSRGAEAEWGWGRGGGRVGVGTGWGRSGGGAGLFAG